MRTLEKLIIYASSFLSRIKPLKKFYIKFVGALSLGINGHEFSYFSDRNGENALLLRSLRSLSTINEPIIIFDGGCNRGTYTDNILKIAHSLNIENISAHLFDIDPSMIKRCSDKFSGDRRVHISCVGLSDRKQSSQARFYPEDTTRNSLLGTSPEPGWDSYISDVELVTGDQYAKNKCIEYIHYLKLDLEGYDLEALMGFESMLKSKSIKYIQFEYTFRALERRILIKDFFELLSSYGYKFATIKLNTIEVFNEYNPRMENWLLGPNFFSFCDQE